MSHTITILETPQFLLDAFPGHEIKIVIGEGASSFAQHRATIRISNGVVTGQMRCSDLLIQDAKNDKEMQNYIIDRLQRAIRYRQSK